MTQIVDHVKAMPDQAEYVFAKAEAQRASTLIQVAAIAAAVICVALAAALQKPINQQRKDLQLVMQSNIYKELPPKYAWVSAAGATFRGVAADILWMRADNLKQEGKYYESHQLAKWICTLQPRFAAVWSFQSWNMAYNISVATHTTRERWQWVYNGIRLLRDEGIPNNEKVVPLYHQLAWTWFHKVGDRMDDHHWHYKRIWATTMEVLLGTPPAGATDAEQIAWFRVIAEAPRQLDTVIAEHPGVAALVRQLSDLGIDVNAETSVDRIFHPLEVKLFKPYTVYLLDKRLAPLRKTPRQVDEATAKLRSFFDAAPAADFQPLLAYLRAKVLREQYKMDPGFMLKMTTMLGTKEPLPIDWRTPWSEAMYWGMYGTMEGAQAKNAKPFDLLNTDRIVLFSLGALSRQGRYLFRPNLESPEDSFLSLTPDYRYVEAIHQKCLQFGKKYAEKGEDVGNTAGEGFKDFHINTLHSNIVGLWLAGREEQARKYFEYLAANYKDQFTGKVKEMYLGTFRDFIQAQLKEMAGSQQEAVLVINALLDSAYMALANGQRDEYAANVSKALEVYKSYQRDRSDDREGRRTLPPFEQMRADGLERFITDPTMDILIKYVVWDRENNTPIKQRCYDSIIQALQEMYGQTDLNISAAFPAPPGMEQWRKSNPAEKPEDVARQAQEAKKERERRQQE